jgi:hypothetical protein
MRIEQDGQGGGIRSKSKNHGLSDKRHELLGKKAVWPPVNLCGLHPGQASRSE